MDCPDKIMKKFTHITRTCGLVVLLVMCIPSSRAQTKVWEPAYTNISVNEGLPSSETYYVYQDRKGFIWICTDRGVVRFDGYRYQLFTREKGLLDNVVFKVMEDQKGRIWFKSYNDQWCYFENDRIHAYKYNHLLSEFRGVYLTPYSWFDIDLDDNFYFSIKGKNQILKISANGKKTLLKTKYPVNYTKIGSSWFFTSDMKLFNKGTNVHVSYDGKKSEVNIKPTSRDLSNGRQEVQQFGNKVYITNRNYVYSEAGDSSVIAYITGTNKIGKDLWVATLMGAYLYENIEKNGLKAQPKQFLSQYSVTSICKDREGGYWFSTLENGVIYTPDLNVLNSNFSLNSRDNNLYHLYKSPHLFIVSNINGYFDFYSGKKLSAALGTGNGIIPYLGNTPFLGKLREENKKTLPGIQFFINGYRGWCKESDTSILLTGLGIARYNIKGEGRMIHSYANSKLKHVKYNSTSIALLPGNELIIADLKGIYRLEKNVFQPVVYSEKLKGTRVRHLVYSAYWGLVIATGDKGVFIVRNGKLVKWITESNGLLSDQINFLFVDSRNYLYACSNKGVSRIFYDGGSGYRVQNLTPFQGLKAQEVNSCFEYNNSMYFATKNGLSKTDHSFSWANSSHRNQVKILDIFANGKKVERKNNCISLDYRYKVIRIRLASTNFKTRGKAPYKYRLSKNASWTTGYTGEIILLNPAYDKFNIEIKYKNENGIWSEPYFLTSIEIFPPFYQKIWFYVLVTVCLLVLVILVLLRRLRAINRKVEIQRNMEILEQKALLAQMNPHFIFNALNSIQSFLLYNENELAERYLLKLSKLIRLTLTNSRETEISIQKEIDSLEMYLGLEQMRFKNRFDFRLEISLSKEELNKFVPPMLIQPFAENAIIHGFKGLEQGGMINLNFKRVENNRLIVEIIDNGVGYAKNKADAQNPDHKSYATQITSERLKLFKERYQSEFDFSIEGLKDEHGNLKGTKVVISIPIFNKDS